MSRSKKALWFIPILWGLSGCMGPELPGTQEGVFVVWKTPVMRYADQGFLYREPSRVRLEVYASGQAVMKLSVTPEQVCNGVLCMDKKSFNLRFLSPEYPPDLLDHLLKGEPIFGGENLVRKDHGFTQRIEKEGHYRIVYTVLNGSVAFRDTINQIVIEIKPQG